MQKKVLGSNPEETTNWQYRQLTNQIKIMEVKKPESMVKDQRVSITKGATGMGLLGLNMGWNDPHEADEAKSMDPDLSVVFIHKDGTVNITKDVLFYNSNKTEDAKEWVDKTREIPFIYSQAAASVMGDNRDGAGADDTVKERVEIDLAKLPATIAWIVPVVTIYECKKKGQHFGTLTDCYMEINDTNNVLTPQRADLSEDYSAYEAMIPGYFYKDKEGEWKLLNKAIGINETAESLGEEPNPINVAKNILKLTGIKVAEAAPAA